MFHFFKKKEKKKVLPVVEELSQEERLKLKEEIAVLEAAIMVEEPLASTYESLGLKQAELGEIDAAIISLEQSLSLKKSIGTGYKKLMQLYNLKRAESARNGEDAGIDYYMGKMDEMRQIAKEMVISGQ
ncbi:tetratricopeptide repeat protein [Enterococcus sp. LJL98]